MENWLITYIMHDLCSLVTLCKNKQNVFINLVQIVYWRWGMVTLQNKSYRATDMWTI